MDFGSTDFNRTYEVAGYLSGKRYWKGSGSQYIYFVSGLWLMGGILGDLVNYYYTGQAPDVTDPTTATWILGILGVNPIGIVNWGECSSESSSSN